MRTSCCIIIAISTTLPYHHMALSNHNVLTLSAHEFCVCVCVFVYRKESAKGLNGFCPLYTNVNAYAPWPDFPPNHSNWRPFHVKCQVVVLFHKIVYALVFRGAPQQIIV